MRFLRRFTSLILTVVMICLLVTVGIIRDVAINARANTDMRPVIIIDAGHEGFS